MHLMSKHFAAVLIVFPLILQLSNNCSGQKTDVVITLRSAEPPTVEVQGRTAGNTSRNFSIVRDYAGTSDLADRVSNIVLEDREGQTVAFRQFVPGEYVAERDFVSWRYRMDLTPRKRPAAAAQTSWISGDRGLLFLDDLLPISATKPGNDLDVRIELPTGWWATSEKSFKTTNARKVAILVSKAARKQQINVGNILIDIAILDGWRFVDQDVSNFSREIIDNYRKSFGDLPVTQAAIYILPFPMKVEPGNWEGDTRGTTTVLVSSDMPFQTQSVQRLHEQLRHEIFHLWFPNSISLSGNYDWFYEGFGLYRSLKLGVELNRLRFDDYLDTLGRAITIDSMLTDRRSLLDASSARSSGVDTVIYARGMLAALLTDVETMKRRDGKEDVSTILRKLFNKYRMPAATESGNTAVLGIIDLPSVTRFVSGVERVDWANELKPMGIETVSENSLTSLRVAGHPTSSQKKFLDKLGYNNWRKLTPASK